MASFTDQLVGFNPYVAQIPVDDYVRVGLHKQEQYNQGVAKVQNYIDSVAGMEVIKEPHKAYLQKRVNQLSGEVSKIVAEDFSKQQLVNSVGQLTSQMASDPILQNAQISTQRYKEGISSMKKAAQEGKSAPSNEWYFQSQVNQWLNDGDVSTSLNASYTPFTDVNKKVMDVIKGLHPNAKIEDIPYVRGADGNIKLDRDGQPTIDFAMMRRSVKDLNPETIQTAIRASLDQNDLRQLQIDGMYTYRGLDKFGMKKVADESYNYRLERINDAIKGLLVDRQTNISDPSHVAQVDQQIEALRNRAEQYQSNYRKEIQSLDADPEGYKANTYLQNYLSRFGDGFAYAEHSLTYENNPYFQAAETRRQNDIKFQEFLVDKQFKEKELDIKMQELDIRRQALEIDRAKAEAEIKKKLGAAGGGAPLELTGAALMGDIDQQMLSQINEGSFLAETEQLSANVDNEKMALIAQVRPDLVQIVRSPDGTGRRYEYNVQGKDPNKVKAEAEATVLKLKEAYSRGEAVDDGVKTFFDNVANTDQMVQNRKTAINKLGEAADKTWDIQPLLSRVSPLTMNSASGNRYTLTPDQQVKFNEKLKQVVTERYSKTQQASVTEYNDALAQEMFQSPGEKFLYNIIRKGYDRQNPEERSIVRRIRDVEGLVNRPAEPVLRGRAEYLNNAVRDIVGATQPTAFPVVSFKQEDKGNVLSVIKPLFSSIITTGKSNESPHYDEGDIEKMLNAKNEAQTSFTLEAKGGGRYAIGLHNPNVTGERREIEITRTQAEQLFGAGKFLDDFQAIREAMQLTKGTGRVTTDVQGMGRESAFVLRNGLTNRYGVRYHVEDPLKNGGLQVRLYIYDKEGKEWKETPARFGQLLNEAQITKALSALSDTEIDRILGKTR